MQVKDIMQQEVISLSPDTNALEALQILLEKHISGLPVIDKTDRALRGAYRKGGPQSCPARLYRRYIRILTYTYGFAIANSISKRATPFSNIKNRPM